MGSDAAEVFGMRNRCGRVGRHCVGRKQHRPSFTALSCHATAATSVPSGVEFDKEKYRKPPFPFVLISGQDAMKRSLLINAVDPAVGGVILLGDRGTGKSIAVKAMADIMPRVDVVKGDPFNSHPTIRPLMGPEARARADAGEDMEHLPARVPLVEVPLGSTEDRVCGTINMEKMFVSGEKGFVPGLLAEANQGILYIDEVNLLEDGLVDLILDSAAGGWNTVEREGISIGHPAKFMLVGSGIPQNGELRPQLVDRFGLSVNVSTIMDRDVRIKNAMNRIAYDTDPFGFYETVQEEMESLKAKIVRARSLLKGVVMPTKLQLQISQCCSALNVGLRADLTTVRGACALAALDERQEATIDDIGQVIELSVAHRMQRDPLEPMEANVYRVRSKFRQIFKKDEYDDEKAVTKKVPEEVMKKGDDEEKSDDQAPSREGLKPGAWTGPPGRSAKDRTDLKPGQWRGLG